MAPLRDIAATHTRARAYPAKHAAGTGGAWLLTGVLETMLNDVKPNDGAVFAGTAAAVLFVAVLASYLPARSAGRVDPMIVLRDS